ncbi:MAG: DNA repair protein RadA [bacterium]
MAISKKARTAYYCTECGAEHSRWQGQCRECGQWNTLVEHRMPDKHVPTKRVGPVLAQRIPDITTGHAAGIQSGIAEFDRVLGGHLLAGMTVLLGGEPGIGKSTLVLQAADAYSQKGHTVLYVTGEESPSQLKLRAGRLGVSGESVAVLNSTALEEIMEVANAEKPAVVIVDSIQTTSSGQFDSPPGTVAQVREVAHQLVQQAKQSGFALILIGHVTKDGMVAGPKVLEHIVDTVVYFEGDSSQLYRLLRATKNRFGSIAEIGLFEMASTGLVEVTNPSSLFLSSRTDGDPIGSVVTAICEGNRPILVEVQALVSPANYGTPQRVAGGINNKRLALLLAILEKRGDLPMATNDVFVSIAGGLRLTEPAVDLPILIAIASSHLNRPVPHDLCVFGEVGLSGEVRGVSMIDRRINEAVKLGFGRILLPQSNASKLEPTAGISGVNNVAAALQAALG